MHEEYMPLSRPPLQQKENSMNPTLYIGIVSKIDMLDVVTRKPDGTVETLTLPATGTGVAALHLFLESTGSHARLAVAGVAALGIALALGNAPLRETFIVSSHTARAAELAHYAERAI